MSGVGFWELLFLCMIGLVVLGPKRLPQVANQLGSWVGQARRMTRVMRRQLEEELDFDENLNIRPKIKPASHTPPRDDDSFSPLHKQPPKSAADIALTDSTDDSASDQIATDNNTSDDTPEADSDRAPGT